VQGAYFVSSKLVRAFEQFTEEAVERWDISWRNFEMFNYLSYDAGDFYSWHRDEDDDGPRQLTMIMALNDDYTGGGVELAWRQEMVFKMSVGEVLVFPAKLYHRALPVHSGQRRVIVGWATSD
jgi:predicted 2-oxoglutarate/Fe(II)-dependent dioxygenase YbiX